MYFTHPPFYATFTSKFFIPFLHLTGLLELTCSHCLIFFIYGLDIVIILQFLDPDPNPLSRSSQNGSKPPDPPRNSHLAGTVSGAGAGDDTTASKNDRLLRTHHSSSTVLMLENALAAVKDDASQLPLSDLVQASTMIRDLENVLREKLSRNMGGGE
jgi:hypothetical protein